MTQALSRQALRNMDLIPPLLLSGSRTGRGQIPFLFYPPAPCSLPPDSFSRVLSFG